MPDLDDFRLSRVPAPPPAPRRRVGAWVAGAVLVAAALAGYLYFGRPQPAPPAPEPRAVSEVEIPEAALPLPPPAPALPALDQSDTLVRELVRALSTHAQLAAWLVHRDLLRTFAVSAENIADGVTPWKHLPFLRTRGDFRASAAAGTLFIDPRSYQRYDTLGDVVDSLDAEGCARFYRRVAPLVDEAYRELGHPQGGFDRTLERAFVRVLETPVLERRVAVIQRAGLYEYADPKLEALRPVQKQLIGMGPRNVRLVQRKIRQIAGALDVPAGRLPPP